MAILRDDDATLDDVREALTTLEEIEPIARRVFGGAHPDTYKIGRVLQEARAALRAREDLLEADVESVREAMAAMAPGDA